MQASLTGPGSGRRGVLASLSLCTLLAALGTSSTSVALPVLAREFAVGLQQVQWVLLAYLLALTGLVVGAGRLGDIAGRKSLLLAGLAVFATASLAAALANTLAVLIAARAFQGLGAALMMSLSMALVADSVPRANAGSAMGLLGAVSAAGTTLGPALGGGLIAVHGWPAIFMVNVPLAAVALLLARHYLPADRRGGPDRSRGPTSLLRDGRLRVGLGMSMLVTTVVMASLVIGPFYLAVAFALGPAAVGLAMSCGPLAAALAGVPAGRLADRFGARPVLAGGLALMAAGCLLLCALAPGLGIASYVVPLMIVTSGYAAFQSANNTMVIGGAASGERGLVSGYLNLSRNLGLIFGASVMAMVFACGAAWSGEAAGTAAAVGAGLRLTFAVALGLVLASVALAISPPRQQAGAAGRP